MTKAVDEAVLGFVQLTDSCRAPELTPGARSVAVLVLYWPTLTIDVTENESKTVPAYEAWIVHCATPVNLQGWYKYVRT